MKKCGVLQLDQISNLRSCPLTLTTYTLHRTPCTLHPTPYTLHPTPHSLHPTPYTPHPAHTEPHTPNQLTVVPGLMTASTLSGNGLSVGTAGYTSDFTISARDAYGNVPEADTY